MGGKARRRKEENPIGSVAVAFLCSLVVGMLALSGILLIFGMGNASAAQDGDYTYTTSGTPLYATVTGYTGPGGAINLPSTLGGHPTVVIASRSFYQNTAVTSVTLPASVVAIDAEAFFGCSRLTSVNIPEKVTTIGAFAFWDCTSLTSITIPSNTTSIKSYAFGACTSLTGINVNPGNLYFASVDGAMYNKANTTLIQYPGGKIGPFNVPSSLIVITNYALSDCPSLSAINVDAGNQNYASIDGVLYNKGITTMIQFPAGKGGAYDMPASITTVERYAFSNCRYLSSVTIASGVTVIGDYTFRYCSGLSSITVPSRVSTIGIDAFAECTALTSMTFLGLAAPTSVASGWITGTPSVLRGHADASSNFPAQGNSLNGLIMGAATSANPTVPGVPITPSAPQGLKATFAERNVTLTWTAPAENGGSSILSYEIYRSSTAGIYTNIGAVPAGTLSYLDQNGTAENSSYYVVAVNAAGTGDRSAIQSQTISRSFIEAALPPVAAVAVGSLITFVAFWVVSRASETATSLANGYDSVRADLRRFFRLDKLLDFITGYFKGRAHSFVWKQVSKVELEGTHIVQRQPLFAGFSSWEFGVIIFTSLFLGLAFMITNRIDLGSPGDWLLYILVAGLAVSIHDLVHRYMAWRYGTPTEYKFWFLGTGIMFLTAIAFGVVYSSPSRLAIESAEKMTIKQQAIVYGSGPIVSFALFAVFLAFIPLGGTAATIGKLGASMNLLTAAYALMPFAPMDGLKVYRWKKWAWAAMFVPILATYFALIIFVL